LYPIKLTLFTVLGWITFPQNCYIHLKNNYDYRVSDKIDQKDDSSVDYLKKVSAFIQEYNVILKENDINW